MVKTLIKKQLLELFQTYYVDKKSGKARTKKGTILFFGLGILLFLGLGFAFYSMASSLGIAILGHGWNWLYFALEGLIALALGVFGSVFNTYGSLYLPKDNELMLSLPIPTRKLLFARVCGVYATSLLYSAWIWIPASIAYWIIVPATVSSVVFPILLIFVLALFVTVLSCLLGWVVALISTKTKGKSILTVVLSLVVMALYYVVYFKIINALGEIVNHLDALGNTVQSWLHYFYLLGKAADGDILSMMWIIGITALVFGLCFFVLSKTFMKLTLTGDRSSKKKKVTADYTMYSARTALRRREYRHFTSVSTWMLNGGFGLLLMPISTVALLAKRGSIVELLPTMSAELPTLFSLLPILLLTAICLFVSTGALAPVSVSMEGKSLWIVQSLPIQPWEILHAKENMAVQLTVYPAALLALVGGFVLNLGILRMVLLCICVWFFVWLSIDFGLFLNLKSPNLSWTNAAYLTKQSMPVMINMFGGWGFSLILIAGGFFLEKIASVEVILAGFAIIFFVLWQLIHSWLKTKGTEVLATL